jgi:nicotinamidase-related amidase
MKRLNGLDIPETLAEAVDPRRSALLVYDMQVGVLGQIARREAVTEGVRTALDAARSAGVRVAYMRHRSMPMAWTGVMQAHTAMRWQRTDDPEACSPWFLPGSPGFEIDDAVAPREGEPVIDKIAMSAFEGTFLATILRDCGVGTLAICGVATEIGIDLTCRHAADHALLPVLIEDACAPGHDDAGDSALETLRFLGDTMFTDVAGYAEALRGAAG